MTNSTTKAKNIIVVGASAGGIKAISSLLSSFTEDINASIFIVIHISANSMVEVILSHLQKHSKFPCRIAQDGDQITNKTVFLAPADRHLCLTKDRIIVQKGPFENRYRPSIDVLFRTAAAAYDSCVIGVVLTGLLDDGTSGMSAIKQSGGICIVQDPKEAEYTDMPRNVINNIEVDYVVSVNEMGYIISDIITRKECDPSDVPEIVKKEAEISLRMNSSIERTDELGSPSLISCPDCGGTLFKVRDPYVERYRCYTGHSFTKKRLEDSINKKLEESLWIAIRMMEERKNLLDNLMRDDADNKDNGPLAKMKVERAEQLQIHIERLKTMLQEF